MINTKYKISNTEYLKINPEECVHDNDCQFCTQMDVDYINQKNNLTIRFGYENIRSFYFFIVKLERIQKLIAGTETLKINLFHDIGLEWNEYFENNIDSTEVDHYFWISNSHKQIRPFYSSWLYNDKKGNIIFEITPFYPWFNKTKKTCPDKIAYKEWIKNYKPTVKTIIPKKNILQWVKQAKALGEKYKVNF